MADDYMIGKDVNEKIYIILHRYSVTALLPWELLFLEWLDQKNEKEPAALVREDYVSIVMEIYKRE